MPGSPRIVTPSLTRTVEEPAPELVERMPSLPALVAVMLEFAVIEMLPVPPAAMLATMPVPAVEVIWAFWSPTEPVYRLLATSIEILSIGEGREAFCTASKGCSLFIGRVSRRFG
jgi:hypothetical protein